MPEGSDLNKRWSVTEKSGNHPSVLSSACDQLAELKEKKGHVSFLQVDSAAPRHLQQMDGPLLKGLTFQLSTAQPSINTVTVYFSIQKWLLDHVSLTYSAKLLFTQRLPHQQRVFVRLTEHQAVERVLVRAQGVD